MESDGSTVSTVIIWTGAALSLVGLVGLMWCIFNVTRARRAKLDDEEMRRVLASAIPMNLGALFLSVIGLMLVIVGIFIA